MKKALIFQTSRALGDRLFISWVPKQLKRKLGYDKVYLASWKDNLGITENNPFINDIIHLEDVAKETTSELIIGWEKEYDLFDFRFRWEKKYLMFNFEVNPTIERRREHAKGISAYDCYQEMGLSGDRPEVYLSDEEKKRNHIINANRKKRILWQLTGSAPNKRIPYTLWYIEQVHKLRPEVEHWIAEKNYFGVSTMPEYVHNMEGNPRDVLSHIPTFDLIIGPESFFINAAKAFDVHHITFYSHTAPENYDKSNGYSHAIKPKCDCSPCYLIMKDFRTIYDLDDRARARDYENSCIVWDTKDRFRALGFKCCIYLDHNEVIQTILKYI